MGMEELWDKLLIRFIQDKKPLVFGLATDDAHNYLDHRVGMSNPGRGWIRVKAKELTPAALIAAMENGDFYASTGVELDDVKFNNGTLTINIAAKQGETYAIQFWGAERSGISGKILKEVKGTSASYKLAKNILYIRAKVISSKLQENPFQTGDLERAWTQPVTLSSHSYQ
jgi:hypothetical protein